MRFAVRTVTGPAERGHSALGGPSGGPDRGGGDDQDVCLVVYASKHGATRGIAGRIAAGVRTAGCQADVRPVKDAGDLAAYDAFVIGSAAYESHWRKEATEFVRRNRRSSPPGPCGCSAAAGSAPNPPTPRAGTCASLQCRKRFPSSLTHCTLAVTGLLRRAGPRKADLRRAVTSQLPAARAGLPEGDFRNWPEIDDWAAGIARELATAS